MEKSTQVQQSKTRIGMRQSNKSLIMNTKNPKEKPMISKRHCVCSEQKHLTNMQISAKQKKQKTPETTESSKEQTKAHTINNTYNAKTKTNPNYTIVT